MNVKDLFDLSGKTAIITGGSIGLGAQMAEGLAQAGANVIIAARKIQRCEDLCIKLEENGVRAIPAACDVGKEEDCFNLVNLAVKEFGTVDILINNAGYTWAADAIDYPKAKWDQIMNVNLTGTFQLSVMAARIMRKQERGKIVNIASVTGLGGCLPEVQNTVAYNTSKGAVITLTKDLAAKWAYLGIYVNAIAPSFFPTHMSSGLLEKNQKFLMPRIPLKRLGGEDDLKGAVVFLSSAASDYITGQCLVVDGGQTALV